MVDGYRVLKNRLIHDDVICPQDADAAHLAFWERIQQLEDALHEIYGRACVAMGEDDDLVLYGFAQEARDIALKAAKGE